MSTINGKFLVPPALPDVFDMHRDDVGSKLRVCMVGIIDSYDPAKRTATVLLAENFVLNDGTVLPPDQFPILDVPVMTLQGGGIHIGVPITKGDECMLIFADFNIDNWYAFGGQQTPPDARQHDISDAIAIVGLNSLARPLISALSNDEGGIADALAKVAVKNGMVSIANQTDSLKAIINDTITQVVAVNTGLIADGGVVPNAAAAATTANAQLVLILTRLAALLY